MSHPCQISGGYPDHRRASRRHCRQDARWVSDGNNVCNSLIQPAARFGFTLNIACPAAYKPDVAAMVFASEQGAAVTVTHDPAAAVKDADVVLADTWVSMGDLDYDARMNAFQPYQVNAELMALAKKDALFLHCLPAHRGEEVTEDVIDGSQSVIWDEAENRIHCAKGCPGLVFWRLTYSSSPLTGGWERQAYDPQHQDRSQICRRSPPATRLKAGRPKVRSARILKSRLVLTGGERRQD